MYSVATKRAGRSQGGLQARDIDVPLPLMGLFIEAKTAEISGIYAAELTNFRSNGVLLRLRRSASYQGGDELALQRIPYEFGGSPRYIELRSDRAQCAGAELLRNFDGTAMAAYISSHAVIADGMGSPVLYDGATLFNGSFTTDLDGVGTPGPPSESFNGVIAHHDRLYFWQTGGPLEFYYGDIGAITGTVTRFPLDRLGNITGSIVSMSTLTIDAGNNTNDVLCIFTTTGHVVLYSGLDPSDATDFALVSRMKIAPILSRFAMTQVGSDAWVITSAGIASMRDTLQQGALALSSKVSRPIAEEIITLSENAAAEWQLHTSANGKMVIVNYWDGVAGRQFVYETETGAWATSDLIARWWHNLVLETTFTNGIGLLGIISERDDGTETITATWKSSWFRLGRASQIVSLTPSIIAKGPLTVTVTVLSDHDETQRDIDEATQTVTIYPDNPLDAIGRVALNEVIAIGAQGSVFQLKLEVTAAWAQIVNVKAAVI